MSNYVILLLVITVYLLHTQSMDVIVQDNIRQALYTVYKGKRLIGFNIHQRTVTSPMECSRYCLRNDACLSFNYQHLDVQCGHVCELNNSTRKTSQDLYEDNPHYDFYYDPNVENFRSCLDYLRNGARISGIYTITDTSGDSYQVFCDLHSEPGSAWTLIMSQFLKHQFIPEFCKTILSVNAPKNEDRPNWEAYRLSWGRMNHLSQHSTHARFTTGFTKYGIDYRDYARAKYSDLQFLQRSQIWTCLPFEYINVRGYDGSNITAYVKAGTHGDYSFGIYIWTHLCQFRAVNGSVSGENAFGSYCFSKVNPNFRGSESSTSTTEYWLGGYL